MAAETDTSMPGETPRHILILGSGLAAWMAAAQLSAHLPDGIEVTVMGAETPPAEDALYGQLLPPEAYDFHLALGLDEPTLLLRTDTAFAYGGSVEGWGSPPLNWIQPFQLPVPTVAGVRATTLFHQDRSHSLSDHLVAVQAARAGRFAHPPEDSSHPLSRAEYGYLFDPNELTALYRSLSPRVRNLSPDAEVPEADLVVETRASGVPLDADAQCLSARLERSPVRGPAFPLRRLIASDTGWYAEVITRNARLQLTVGSTGMGESGVTFRPHADPAPWVGNRIRIGQAAFLIEPLTLAPLRLLIRDLQSLVELFPVGTDMQVEAREFNARAAEDQVNARAFHQAHFFGVALPPDPYFDGNLADPAPQLLRKLNQFEERGYFVAFERDPFDELDWAVLHEGIGRQPIRPDTLASMADPSEVERSLGEMRAGIAAVVGKMPPHPVYLTKLLDYLARKSDGVARENHVG